MLGGRRRLGHATLLGGHVWLGLSCDDLRLVGLKLIFLVMSRAVSVLGLSRRETWWKDAETLMLRHQLAVALRERPRAHSLLRGRTGRGSRYSPERCRPVASPGCGSS